MAHQQQYDNYPQSRQPQHHEHWQTQPGQQQVQPRQRGQPRPQYVQQPQQNYERYEDYQGYDDHGGYHEQHGHQGGHQQYHGHQPHPQQHPGQGNQYDPQYYDNGYDQGSNGQWDNGYYDQHDGWGHAQQQGGYQDASGYGRPAPQPQGRGQGQGRRPPPQEQPYAQEHFHSERQPRSPPQHRQDPRTRPADPGLRSPPSQGRGNGQPPNPQQGRRGVQRPPGLDRSLLNPVRPKAMPQDNPFPTFPAQKPKKPGPAAMPVEAMTKNMAQMNMNGGGSQNRPRGASNNRGPPTQEVQHRGQPQDRPDNSLRQDSGHFEGSAPNQRHPSNQAPSGQRPPPMPLHNTRAPGAHRYSDPTSPSQRAFGPNSQRSLTMPHSQQSGGQGTVHKTREQWAEPGVVDGYHGPESPAFIPPRPSTAGGTRHENPQMQQSQRPPMPRVPPTQQQYQPQYQPPAQNYQEPVEDHHGHLNNLYDDYYDDGNDRKSLATEIDMPNFDAIPDTGNKHRRGDSIENHLSPNTRPPLPGGSQVPGDSKMVGGVASHPGPNNAFQRQASRSRSQPDLHGGYTNGVYEMPVDVPPVPRPSRANTGFAAPAGLPSGPRAGGQGPPHRRTSGDGMYRGPPQQGYAQGQPQNFDPRHARQPPPVHRTYSDESAFSEPPPHTMRNVASPVMPGHPIPRPGTAGPMTGRPTHAPPNPDALPPHPTPIRPGLMQQNQQQQMRPPQAAQGVRPPPVRQYNSEAGRGSLESQKSIVRRESEAPHPVTYDELNRLRNAFKSNPSDIATGIKLAKKLAEASNVLADEGGTADTRTRNKNREKFNLEAHKIVKKLVNMGSPDAMFYLADCYGQGLLGLQVDTKEAFMLYQSAAKAGHAASAYRTAVCCEMGHEEGGGTKKDPLKAVQWYRRAAALGDAPALYKMGMILLKGLLGQQKNVGEAINMLKRAADRADRDNPHALHELALIYEAPTGNERIISDEAYALQLFHQAAELGYKFSQFRLGQAYEYGLLGCPIDARTSIAWYTKAAAQGEHQSELALSGWYLTGTSGILEQSDTEAYLWARKAACAEPPLPKALFAMGYFTEVGIGCPSSLSEAKQWYGRAAAFKFPKAQERLEELKKGGSKAQMKRERLSRTNQKQQEENCTVM
ncbi:hypothetical protein LEMA_P041850.1 [Plenodomus lingam JN3]|uniref:Chitin synthase activator (Chs3) n=2 Tax=Leptosphaeria maculans TaxID=5022 RepID=E4ZNR5_LEPMJ|nr:hypothetical protein LEMA_P041850.1 [Plenodomus lingam JN3]CBX93284.1 hypothetical protein LEMA_P041850.1 [Plenodomus lingam JN3]